MAQREKESAGSAGDQGSNTRLGRSSGEGNSNPLQYSSLENPMDGGAWQAPWGHKESDTTELISLSFLSFLNIREYRIKDLQEFLVFLPLSL